jgi:hypothetical protein
MNLNSPITGDDELDSYLFLVRNLIDGSEYKENLRRASGFSGTFTTNDGRTVTVLEGTITSVV